MGVIQHIRILKYNIQYARYVCLQKGKFPQVMGESDPLNSYPESNTTMIYRIFRNQNLTQNVAKGMNDYENITIIRYQYNFHVRIAFKK